ncbi:MAG: transglycosylase SLT domain-containing protein [Acidobacteria bacterium]|nr:transglycosylase SLT domain-containing protein [Acidobacteriota bacterium]
MKPHATYGLTFLFLLILHASAIWLTEGAGISDDTGPESGAGIARAGSREPGIDSLLHKFEQGVNEFEGKNWSAAVQLLSDPKLESETPVGDRALSLLASAYVALGRDQEAAGCWDRLVDRWPDSILRSEAKKNLINLHARSRRFPEARRVRAPGVQRGDVEVMLALAGIYEQELRTGEAVRLYRTILIESPVSRASYEAQLQLTRMRAAPFDPDAVAYDKAALAAKELYQAGAFERTVWMAGSILDQYKKAKSDELLQLQWITSLYRSGNLRKAGEEIHRRTFRDADSQAQALWLRVEMARNQDRTAVAREQLAEMVSRFPRSEWTAKSLSSLAMHELKRDRTGEAMELWRTLFRLQPASPQSSEGTYRLGRQAYHAGEYGQAADYFLAHVEQFPGSDYFGTALYWLGRAKQQLGREADAAVCFRAVHLRYPHGYFAQQAEARMTGLVSLNKSSKPASSAVDGRLEKALKAVTAMKPVAVAATGAALAHRERASIYRKLDRPAWAIEELEAALTKSPRAAELSLLLGQVLSDQGHHLAATNALRRAYPDYLNYREEALDRREWNLFFPLEEWETIRTESRGRGVDPYLIAGLIRQESGFNQRARSSANARGLMQMLPSTGRLVGRAYGRKLITAEQLYDPRLNIRLGVRYFTDLVKKFGKVEYALAAYNGGPGRVARWTAQYPNLELDEWVDRIPITETRLYVQGVLRNAERYRRLYGDRAR